jgi:hypothetical protein
MKPHSQNLNALSQVLDNLWTIVSIASRLSYDNLPQLGDSLNVSLTLWDISAWRWSVLSLIHHPLFNIISLRSQPTKNLVNFLGECTMRSVSFFYDIVYRLCRCLYLHFHVNNSYSFHTV